MMHIVIRPIKKVKKKELVIYTPHTILTFQPRSQREACYDVNHEQSKTSLKTRHQKGASHYLINPREWVWATPTSIRPKYKVMKTHIFPVLSSTKLDIKFRAH